MKIIGLEDQKEEIRKINKKKVTIAIAIGISALILIILTICYIANRSFREVIDKYVLMKNVIEDSTTSIALDENDTYNIFAYDKYIVLLQENTLTNYNSSGKEESKLKIEISTPIMATNGKYLLIAEKEKNKIYLIAGNEIIWQKELEGNINNITVNKNGYTAVILSGTTYKSVIQTFDTNGNELFKTYLSSTTAMDVDISLDNQYLAFAEINSSGTVAQSTIKIISIPNAKANQKEKSDTQDPIVAKIPTQDGKLITNIKYQESNKLLCMYDDEICVINNNEKEEIVNLVEDDNKIAFGGIELYNRVYRVTEKISLLNTLTNIEIINTSNKKANIYVIDGVAKELFSYESNLAVNLGSEVHFINTSGWLLKKYISSQEIKNIIMCSNFAGIVYRNKIEIVTF